MPVKETVIIVIVGSGKTSLKCNKAKPKQQRNKVQSGISKTCPNFLPHSSIVMPPVSIFSYILKLQHSQLHVAVSFSVCFLFFFDFFL